MAANSSTVLFRDPLSTPISIALLLVRVFFGLGIALHGLQKMQHPFTWMGPSAPIPGILQAAAAFGETLGGLGWIAGLLTPFASLLVGATMTVATFMSHISRGDPLVRLSAGAPPAGLFGLPEELVRIGGRGASWELASHYLIVSVLLLLAGPGRISLDAILFGRRSSRR